MRVAIHGSPPLRRIALQFAALAWAMINQELENTTRSIAFIASQLDEAGLAAAEATYLQIQNLLQ